MAWSPNQTVGSIGAAVQFDGYRLFDRWSPQTVGVDVPADAKPAIMQVLDLNLWNNDLHPANVTIRNGPETVWSQQGKFTGQAQVDVSGTLRAGPNLLTLTQDDLLGGQVLVTFPYVYRHTILATAEAHGWIEPAGAVAVNHGANQAFTITPERDYCVTNVLVDGVRVEPRTNFTFTNVISDHTIHAAFAPAPPLKFTAWQLNPNGTVTVEWTGGGVLQAAPTVLGPWFNTLSASSPSTIAPTWRIMFLRIRK
jgi:hypothetical protein